METPIAVHSLSTIGIVEAYLKDRSKLYDLLRSEGKAAEVAPKFLTLSLLGFTLFGALFATIFSFTNASVPWLPRVAWADGSAFSLIAAYDFGLIAASGVCLPCFYFFGLLAGLRAGVLRIVLVVLEGLAATSIVLVGLLPPYFAIALGLVVLHAGATAIRAAFIVGLLLPFVAGLGGIRTIRFGLGTLSDTFREDRRAARTCFMNRLVTAWALLYTVVTPVMIHALWRHFA
jgi:hypothetical protein